MDEAEYISALIELHKGLERQGAGALLLASKYRTKIKAVDLSSVFLNDYIKPIRDDMGALNWDTGSIGLLWSEGAAYNITFEGALKAWQPFMATGGIIVISEMSYFSDDVSKPVSEYMKNTYPGIKMESKNIELIKTSDYQFIEMHRLPSEAWWNNYYNPLKKSINKFKQSGDNVMNAVITDTENEMNFFREYNSEFGYTFYIMKAI